MRAVEWDVAVRGELAWALDRVQADDSGLGRRGGAYYFLTAESRESTEALPRRLLTETGAVLDHSLRLTNVVPR